MPEEMIPVIIDGVEIPGYFVSKTGKIYTTTKFKRAPGPCGFIRDMSLSNLRQMSHNKKNDKEYVNLSIPGNVRADYSYYRENNSLSAKRKMPRYVHQIVMESYRPIDKYPPERLKDVWDVLPEEAKQWVRETVFINHKDHDPYNNNLDNLEYVTPRENSRKAVEHYGGNTANKSKMQMPNKDRETAKQVTIMEFI